MPRAARPLEAANRGRSRRCRPRSRPAPSASCSVSTCSMHPFFSTARRWPPTCSRCRSAWPALPTRAAGPRRSPRRGAAGGGVCSAAPSAIFELGDPPDYEPRPGRQRRRPGRGGPAWHRRGLALDLLLERRRPALLYLPFLNYADGNLDAVGDARPPQHRARPLRRRRARRHDLRRQLPDVPAHPLGPRPDAGPLRPGAPGPAAVPRHRRAPSACSTAACSLPATGPTST